MTNKAVVIECVLSLLSMSTAGKKYAYNGWVVEGAPVMCVHYILVVRLPCKARGSILLTWEVVILQVCTSRSGSFV